MIRTSFRLLAVATVVVVVIVLAAALRVPGLSRGADASVPPTPESSVAEAPSSSTAPQVTAPAASMPDPVGSDMDPLPTIAPDVGLRVETTGDDAGDGSRAHPWRTLSHAVTTAPAGATIRLGPGSFDGTTVEQTGLTIVGEPGQTSVVGGLTIDTGATGVTVTGLTLTGVTEPYSGGLMVRGADGAVIVGNVVRGNPFGIHLVDATGARIERNTVTDNGYGLEIHGRTDGTTIVANDIVDNDRRVDKWRGGGGINLYFTHGGITIERNRIQGNHDVGIEIYGASDLDIRENVLTGSNDLIETGTQEGQPCDNLSITRNVLYSDHVGDREEERGIYLRCASDAVVSWNTFDGLDRFDIGLFRGNDSFSGPMERLEVSHNIFAGGRAFSIDSDLPPDITLDHDVFSPCRADVCPLLGNQIAFVHGHDGTDQFATFRQWSGQEANGIVADPVFRDQAGHDYRLQPGSPAAGLAGRFDAPAD